MSRRVCIAAFLLYTVTTAACRREAPSTIRVENPALGIAVAAVPEPFEVFSAAGETIELRAPGRKGLGEAMIAAGPVEQHGINLVDAVKERRSWYEATPGANYLGNRELGTPIGTAFTARGTYLENGVEIEETRVFAIHPAANRLLTVTFTYPTGESEERVTQLMSLLGEIEGLPPEPESDAGD